MTSSWDLASSGPWQCMLVLLALLWGAGSPAQAQPASGPGSSSSLPPPCAASAVSSGSIASSCSWATQQVPAGLAARIAGASVHPGMPWLHLPTVPAAAEPPAAGFGLVLQRLVLANAVLAPPAAAGLPKLWPLGLFAAPGTNLTMADVRLLVSDATLQQFIAFFQPFGRQTTEALKLHSDGSSFLHISAWSDRQTFLRSVTLLAGPCAANASAAVTVQPPLRLPPTGAAAAAAAAASNGSVCGVHTVDNSTLVPLLASLAAVPTDKKLLVLLVANVSLGHGLAPGAIDVLRPVVMAGLWSMPVGVDFGMVVNQLNVTAEHSQLFWQSLFLENIAPGDAVSSIMAPPYSSAVSANLYAMYCNRTMNCLNLMNTTSTLATQQEMDYVTFMYSMFNSPLPNMRQHTAFYHTELKVTILQMGPGPNGIGMTLYNMSTSAWQIFNGVFTTQYTVAKKLPLPPGAPLIAASTQAAPWVQAITDCQSLQAAMQYPSAENRLHVWMLLNNVSLSPPDAPDCWQLHDVRNPTQVYGQVRGNMQQQAQTVLQQQAGSLPSPAVLAAVGAAGAAAGGGRLPLVDTFAMSFDYKRAALQLPPAAGEKFLQLQNVTLLQLPQGPRAQAAVAGQSPLPPDVWTLLLWPVNRTMAGSTPVFMSDVLLLLPQPEFDVLQRAAAGQSSFVIPLEGSIGLAFSDVSQQDGTLRLGSFQGPGITGSGIWLLPDPAAAGAMTPPHNWPVTDPAAIAAGASSSSSSGRKSVVIGAVVGAVVGAALLALLGLCCCCCWRRKQRQREQLPSKACDSDSSESQLQPGKPGAGGGLAGPDDAGPPAVAALAAGKQLHGRSGLSVDVSQLTDTSGRKHSATGSGRTTPSGLVQVPEQHEGQGGSASSLSAAADAELGLPASGSSNPARLSRRNTSSSPASSNRQGGEAGGAPDSSATGASSLPLDSSASSDAIALGLKRWSVAISSTMRLMERRMHMSIPQGAAAASGDPAALLTGCRSSGASIAAAAAAAAASAAAAAGTSFQVPSSGLTSSSAGLSVQQQSSLQLHHLVGQGSFGCVYSGTWHGKRVAVKVMQLPATALLGMRAPGAAGQQGRGGQSAVSPHMAIMETVVSRTMSHPNVVQVYTYMLNPLKVDGGGSSQLEQRQQQQQQQQQQGASGADEAPAGLSDGKHTSVSGWELKLVMEFCDQGTLREALDGRLLQGRGGPAFLYPAIVLSLAHDTAAALLHLHSESVVHGDLKAANVMLTKGGEDPGGVWAAHVGHRCTAKVADFGLALPLDPNDTHATLAARGTPTHISPELFMSGHVSRASDVFAYGILLFEIITGQRAYPGVPIPLLPHEVACQGLRPTWPPGLPSGCRDLCSLAEACWAQLPQDRPTFEEIFEFLDSRQAGRAPASLPRQPQQQQQQQQRHLQQQEDGSRQSQWLASSQFEQGCSGIELQYVHGFEEHPQQQQQQQQQQQELLQQQRQQQLLQQPPPQQQQQQQDEGAGGVVAPSTAVARQAANAAAAAAAAGRQGAMSWSEVTYDSLPPQG